ncbi:hypothetical protein AB837_00522 [bacterium AB1]|nr:hypothetical protein AB837_00522 [bacterium AB1]
MTNDIDAQVQELRKKICTIFNEHLICAWDSKATEILGYMNSEISELFDMVQKNGQIEIQGTNLLLDGQILVDEFDISEFASMITMDTKLITNIIMCRSLLENKEAKILSDYKNKKHQISVYLLTQLYKVSEIYNSIKESVYNTENVQQYLTNLSEIGDRVNKLYKEYKISIKNLFDQTKNNLLLQYKQLKSTKYQISLCLDYCLTKMSELHKYSDNQEHIENLKKGYSLLFCVAEFLKPYINQVNYQLFETHECQVKSCSVNCIKINGNVFDYSDFFHAKDDNEYYCNIFKQFFNIEENFETIYEYVNEDNNSYVEFLNQCLFKLKDFKNNFHRLNVDQLIVGVSKLNSDISNLYIKYCYAKKESYEDFIQKIKPKILLYEKQNVKNI